LHPPFRNAVHRPATVFKVVDVLQFRLQIHDDGGELATLLRAEKRKGLLLRHMREHVV
jgi:hypothetical protein